MTRRLSLESVAAPIQTLPNAGDLVAGKYRIEHKLGSGGMGAVFAVRHSVTGRRFAIKWLLASGVESAQAARRFVREAEIAGRIQHPHVVDIYDIYQEESGFFLVMELLEGESLASRLEREGCLSVQETCRIMLPCAAGVAAAHASGVLHLDLKPGNIFLCQTQDAATLHPKVLDFGIARLTAAADGLDTTEKRTGTVIGTPYYMAPEQLRAEACDERVDVYALGVTLYELLSGKRPFEAVSYADLVLKIDDGCPPRLDSLVPELPSGLVAVVMRAMHRDAAARYPSVEALIEALTPFAGTAATATRRSRLRRRTVWVAAILACGAAAIAGSDVWVYVHAAAQNKADPPNVQAVGAERTPIFQPDIGAGRAQPAASDEASQLTAADRDSPQLPAASAEAPPLGPDFQTPSAAETVETTLPAAMNAPADPAAPTRVAETLARPEPLPPPAPLGAGKTSEVTPQRSPKPRLKQLRSAFAPAARGKPPSLPGPRQPRLQLDSL